MVVPIFPAMIVQPLLTEHDAAALLRISITKFNRLVRQNVLPVIELPGGDIRFDADDLRSWARSLKRTIEPQPLSC